MGLEEINLRDMIEVLLKAKRLIAGVTIVAMLVSGLVSFFVLTPTYEATATILVNNPTPAPRPAVQPGLDQILNQLSSTPTMSLEAYRSQVTSRTVLANVIKDLNLDMGVSDLADKVKATTVKDTGLIRVSVADQDPNVATQIANQVVQEYLVYVNQLASDQVAKSGQFIQEQMTEQEKLLSQAMDDLKKLLQQSPSADELQKEINAKMDLLAQLKTDRIRLDISAQQTQAGVSEMTQALLTTPDVLVTKKSISDDPYLQQLAGSLSHQDALVLSGLSMQSEQVNPVKTSLETSLSERKTSYAELLAQRGAMDTAIAQTEKSLEQLRVDEAEKQIAQDKLQQKVDVLKKAYDALGQKYEEVRLNGATQFAEATLTVASQASPPRRPTGPHKALNVALAAVLGLMASVFLAFFLDFWRNSSPSTRPRVSSGKASGV
ncbi:MAG: GumC family protein [Symbiobacteriia bacterium]